MEKKAFLPVLLLLCAILLAGCGRSGSRDSFQTVSDLNRPDVTIGGQTGSAHEPLIAEVFPLAKEKQFAGGAPCGVLIVELDLNFRFMYFSWNCLQHEERMMPSIRATERRQPLQAASTRHQ